MRNIARRSVPSALALLLLLAASGSGEAQTQFTAALTGAQEVPPVATSATGAGFFTLTPAGVTFSIRVEGLTGAISAAHFHVGPPGVNGPIVRTIPFVAGTAAGIWQATDPEPLTAAHIAALLAGNLYVNVHTGAHPDGEIRGQLRVPPLAASILPSSRSVQVGTAATAFATIINLEAATAVDCGVSLHTAVPATFAFQTTDPATNALVGTANTRVEIPAGAPQSFLIAVTPTAPIAPTDVQFRFACGAGNPAFAVSRSIAAAFIRGSKNS